MGAAIVTPLTLTLLSEAVPTDKRGMALGIWAGVSGLGVALGPSNGVSFATFFGAFGAIFLLSQYFQTAQGYSPFEAGLRTLPWTGMPMLVAPIAGLLSDRIGSRPRPRPARLARRTAGARARRSSSGRRSAGSA